MHRLYIPMPEKARIFILSMHKNDEYTFDGVDIIRGYFWVT